jgi:glucosamine-6-phosphate deaminase
VRVIETDTASAFAGAAADFIADRLRREPQSVLALPTGKTPLGLYAELVHRSRQGAVNLMQAQIFNLDEYCGLPPADPHSYAAFLHRHLIAPLKLVPERVRLLRGDAADLEAECGRYDAALSESGGVDLCILGLGANGHIAFNEPGTPWSRRTHIVELSQSTRASHAKDAPVPWQIPTRGITLGVQSLLETREILLLIAGAHKQRAKAALYRGKQDLDWPVTSLLKARSLTVIELCAPERCP